MGRTALDAERALERREVGVDREREARLQQRAPVMPVEAGGEVDPRRVGPKPNRLDDHAVAEAAGDAHSAALAAGFDDLDRVGGDLFAVLAIVALDVPGVVDAWLVAVGPELVATSRQRLAAGALVVDAGERPIVGQLDAQEAILQ